jgi:hypothetical protein
MKYFLAEIDTKSVAKVVFDRWVTPDYFETLTDNKWVFINFGDADFSSLSEMEIMIICYTKNDPEGLNLSKLQDSIVEVVKSEGSDRNSIPFYDTTTTISISGGTPVPSWTGIGGITLMLLPGGSSHLGDKGVNVAIMNVRCLWGTKT